MNLIGCYSREQMNPGDYTFDENSTMKITTKDTVYNFSGNDYQLVNDTLIVVVTKKLDEKTSLKYNVEIPVNDMEKLEIKRTDVVATTFTVIGLTVGILALIGLAGASGGGGNTGCKQVKGKGSIGSI